MLENRLDESGIFPGSPVRLRKRARADIMAGHELATRPVKTGTWNLEKKLEHNQDSLRKDEVRYMQDQLQDLLYMQ